MKKVDPQQLKVVYEYVPPDPANEKSIRQGLERGFDMLFDKVLRADLDALKLREMSERDKASSPQKPAFDDSA